MSDTQATPSRMNPLVAVAAVAVTLFSLVGMGVMTGVIPTSKTTPQEASPVAATTPALPAAVAPPPAPVAVIPTPAPAPVATTPAPVAVAPAPPPAPRPVQQRQPQPTVAATGPATYPQASPTFPATYDTPPSTPPARTPSSSYPPAVAQVPAPRATCYDCGRVQSVNVVQVAGEGSGLGAIAGGVVGGVLGNQVGGGTGRKVATVAGAAGGAYAGHQAEKYYKSGKRYDVAVRMEDGSMRTFPYENEPGFRSGDRVRVVEGKLQYN